MDKLAEGIRKILENINLPNLPRIDYNIVPLVTIIGDKGIKQLTTQILKLVRDKIEGMKKKCSPLPGSLEDKYGYLAGQRKGYADALDDILKELGGS